MFCVTTAVNLVSCLLNSRTPFQEELSTEVDCCNNRCGSQGPWGFKNSSLVEVEWKFSSVEFNCRIVFVLFLKIVILTVLYLNTMPFLLFPPQLSNTRVRYDIDGLFSASLKTPFLSKDF